MVGQILLRLLKSRFMNKIKFLLLLFVFLIASCGGGGDDDVTDPNPPVVTPPGPDNPDDPDDPDNPDDPDDPDTPDEPDEPEYPTFEAPEWKVDNYSKYEYSMTAYMSIPASAGIEEDWNDELAIFSSSECRGVAERLEIEDSVHIWVALIYGTGNNETLTFKYYSSKSKHMYQSPSYVTFRPDEHMGDVDSPMSLDLEIVTSE